MSKKKEQLEKDIRVSFHFWDFKLVLIDSALSFSFRYSAYIFLKCRCGTKKSSQTLKFGLKYF